MNGKIVLLGGNGIEVFAPLEEVVRAAAAANVTKQLIELLSGNDTAPKAGSVPPRDLPLEEVQKLDVPDILAWLQRWWGISEKTAAKIIDAQFPLSEIVEWDNEQLRTLLQLPTRDAIDLRGRTRTWAKTPARGGS